MDEFLPLQHFYRLTRLWWLIVLCAVLGLGAANLFHRLNPPVYQATASINVTIDLAELQILSDIPKDKLQYNEDLAVSVTDQAFRALESYETVLARAIAQGLPIPDVGTLYLNHTLERRHAVWQIHYRHTDPQVAQSVADIWAEVAYENMSLWLSTGQIPAYLVVMPPVQAALPTAPVLYDLYRLLIAGTLIGLILGIFLAELLARRFSHSQPASTDE
jgi:uncharacterized protein involved in exopolysaccharide biosynthesis